MDAICCDMNLFLMYIILCFFLLTVSAGMFWNMSKEYFSDVEREVPVPSLDLACYDWNAGGVTQQKKEYVSEDRGKGCCNLLNKLHRICGMMIGQAGVAENECYIRLLSERYRDGFYIYFFSKLII